MGLRSFIFYRSWYTAAESLSEEERLRFLAAVLDYAFRGVKDESLSAQARAMLEMVIPMVDYNAIRLEKRKQQEGGGR